jgi:hypothetical protein
LAGIPARVIRDGVTWTRAAYPTEEEIDEAIRLTAAGAPDASE